MGAYRLLPFLMMFVLALIGAGDAAPAAEPFKLEADEQGYRQDPAATPYPAPQMIQPPGLQAGDVYTSAPRRQLNSGAQVRVALPPQFLGAWHVLGRRMKVESQPEFQNAAQNAFSISTDNVWQIAGSQAKGYTMSSNTGAQTTLIVDAVQGNRAFIRYQHQVGNTMAQEAIVMELAPGNAAFTGLERVSIVKEPGSPPRARITYQLSGSRRGL